MGYYKEFYKNELSKTNFIIGSGKSGMKMWISKTKYFFIKELNKTDDNSFRDILLNYFKYMSLNKNSYYLNFMEFIKKYITYIFNKI